MADHLPHPPAIDFRRGGGLFTDLYELTMARAFDEEGMDGLAVFELYFRSLPPERNFVVAAGLADALAYLEHLHFAEDDLAFLRGLGHFPEPFLDRLRRTRFTGDVYAVPEGTVVFPNEPVLQVVAPILEAQLVETYLLNQIHFQSVLASKAARVVLAAGDRKVVEFGSRRAHGADAALQAARTAYLVGAIGTSNVLAGKLYGIPTFGTMAHSYIQAHDTEAAAFEAFARLYPGTTLLVDTVDTLDGVRSVVRLARELGEAFRPKGIRLDSGDLASLAVEARRLLDAGGLPHVRIFASGGLDDRDVQRLVRAGAPIDTFGVGTKMVVSRDAPELDFSYKLVEYAGRGRTKLSTGKVIHPGRKQVFRRTEAGAMAGDTVAPHDEPAEGEPLLRPVMRGGAVLPGARIPLRAARDHAAAELARLPAPLRSLDPAPEPYPVRISRTLEQRLAALR